MIAISAKRAQPGQRLSARALSAGNGCPRIVLIAMSVPQLLQTVTAAKAQCSSIRSSECPAEGFMSATMQNVRGAKTATKAGGASAKG